MDPNTPPSPAPSNGGVLPNGFDALVQHNSVTSHPSDQLVLDSIHVRTHSQPATRYGTPVPHGHSPAPMGYEAPAMESYYSQPPYSQHSSPYALADDLHTTGSHHYSTPATSPPTPSRNSDIITRSGNRITRGGPLSPQDTSRPRGIQKKSAAKKGKKKNTKADAERLQNMLQEPLSKTSKTFASKMAWIETFANRDAAKRHEETHSGKDAGKVKRPMNAFMLYRKVFHEDAKEQTSEQNHQILSQLCAASWRAETAEVRAKFSHWAALERDAHKAAFPNYKFKPAKSNKGHRGTPRDDNEDEDEVNLDDEWERGYRVHQSRSRTHTPDRNPDDDYIPDGHHAYMHHPAYGHMQHMHHPMAGSNYQVYSYHGQAKPMPAPSGLMQQYPPQGLRRTPSPMGGYPPPPHHPQQQMYHMPQQSHMYELPQPHHAMSPMQHMLPLEQRMDPNMFTPPPPPPPQQQQHQHQQGHPQQQPFFRPGMEGMPEAHVPYQGAFSVMEDMMAGYQDPGTDDILKNAGGDWNLETIDNGDINSNAWIDSYESSPAPGTVAPAATLKSEAGP